MNIRSNFMPDFVGLLISPVTNN